MELKKIFLPVGSVLLVAAGYRAWGWGGVAFTVGGLLLWLLLHYNRLVHVLRRAAERPIGYLDSAVMLNARLKAGLSLLHVMALTRALGEPLSPKDSQPERFRWTDASDASVICEFLNGKLVRWELTRPPTGAPEGLATLSSPAP
jgi:hypothetical protein